ncbi:hypothetical protein BW716_06235 [[Flexibacter] sp. ATCC 35208]|nr:hypothetical protein BW716_06235 [[Flexibacter] sp. ATCC 35208]
MNGYSQTPVPIAKEYTSQKQTQIEYLLTQIAALQNIILKIKKGYNIVKEGTDIIHDIKNGEFHLHDDYYTSLKAVSPEVKEFGDQAQIVANQLLLIKNANSLSRAASGNSILSANQKTAINTACTQLSADAFRLIDDLKAVLTDSTYSMSDDHRMAIIDRLRERSKRQWAFYQAYQSEASSYVRQAIRDQVEHQTIKSQYGIK